MGRLGRLAAWVLVTVLIALSGCDTMAIGRPAVPLEVRTQAGEGAAFDPASLVAPPNTLVALSFSNASVVDHNLVFLDPIIARTREIIRPGESERVEFRTPGVGTYDFVCTIHEEMRGALVVR